MPKKVANMQYDSKYAQIYKNLFTRFAHPYLLNTKLSLLKPVK